MTTVVAIVSLLTALIGALVRFFPQKTAADIKSERVKGAQDAENKFEQSNDTSDLGKLP